MNENSKIAKNSIILYIRLLIVLFIGIFSSRYILQALGISDFGLYNVVGGIVSMMAVLNSVMASTSYRFIAIELGKGKDYEVNNVYNISLVIHIIIAIIVLLLAETLGIFYIKHYLNIASGKLGDALFVFHFSILGTIIMILCAPCQGLIIAKEKFSVTATVEIIRSFLAFGAVLFTFLYSGNKLRIYALLISIISILPSLFYYLYSRYRFISITKWNLQKDKSKYKEMFSFSGWLMFGAAANVGEIQGSVLLINLFFGTIINASYGLANQVNNMVKLFSQSLNSAAVPQINKSWGSGNISRTMQLVIFSSKYSFFLMLLPSLPVLLETNFIMKLWLKEVPPYSSVFIRIMILNALFDTMSVGIYANVHATGKIKYFQIILNTIGLMGLLISYILFNHGFPVYSILLVYSIIYVINFLVMQILVKRIINFNRREFFNKAILKMINVCILILPLFLVRDLFAMGMERFIGVTLLSCIWLVSVIYFFGMERNEKIMIRSYVRKFIKFHKPNNFEE